MSEAISQLVAKLAPEHLLVTHKTLRAYIVGAHQAPKIVKEIGRLREHTFSAAGAGTGRDIDLDQFDQYYLHLFIWDEQTQQIAGAYRLGLADEIVRTRGVEGMYTASLFDINQALLEQIGPAIELGRSFISADYQKSFAPLLVLWKGIMAFVLRNPRYTNLIGSVGVHNNYRLISRQVMVAFAQENAFDQELAAYIKARVPMEAVDGKALLQTNLEGDVTLENVSKLISLLEPDNKGVPVLMRQYLKLDASFLGFNVDQQFNSLACLLRVNLLHTSPRILARYASDQELTEYFSYHNKEWQRRA